MLNSLGRPLEFHCTTPVKPSRAHEILYGHTLKSHLFGERLCQALIEKATRRPDLILTDLDDVMSLTPPAGSQLAQLVRIEEGGGTNSVGVIGVIWIVRKNGGWLAKLPRTFDELSRP